MGVREETRNSRERRTGHTGQPRCPAPWTWGTLAAPSPVQQGSGESGQGGKRVLGGDPGSHGPRTAAETPRVAAPFPGAAASVSMPQTLSRSGQAGSLVNSARPPAPSGPRPPSSAQSLPGKPLASFRITWTDSMGRTGEGGCGSPAQAWGRGRITWQGGRGWGVDGGSPGQACGAFLFVSCSSQWDLEGHPFNSSLLHSGTGSPSLCALWENSQVTPICKTRSRDSLPSRRRTRYVSPDAEKAVDENSDSCV